MRSSSCAVVYGRAWSFVVVRGRLWSCVVVRGRARSFMVVHGRSWSCAERCGVMTSDGYTHAHTNKPPRAGVQTSCLYQYESTLQHQTCVMMKQMHVDVKGALQRGSSGGRTPDSKSKEPRFESFLCYRFTFLTFSFSTMPQSTQFYK